MRHNASLTSWRLRRAAGYRRPEQAKRRFPPRHLAHFAAALVGLGLPLPLAQAEDFTLQFDSLPSQQGFSYVFGTGSSDENDVFTLDGNGLRSNTIPQGEQVTGGNFYERDLVIADDAVGFTLNVTAALFQEVSFNKTHFGFAYAVGPFFFGLGNGAVQVNGDNTPESNTVFSNTVLHNTSQITDYRLEGNLLDGTFVFYVNDVARSDGQVTLNGGRHLRIGDITGAINASGKTFGLEYRDVFSTDRRHYVGPDNGVWEDGGAWADTFGAGAGGAGKPTANNPVFINFHSVNVTQSGQDAQSILVNGGVLRVQGAGGLTVAQDLELGNSQSQGGLGEGQGNVVQRSGGDVTVHDDLIVGGEDSVYEIQDGSILRVHGDLVLVDDSNALFRHRGGDVAIGAAGDGSDGLLDLGDATTYEMDGGSLTVKTIRQNGLFIFRGGTIQVQEFIINNVTQPTSTGPPTPGDVGGGGVVTGSGGFTLERGVVVINELSDWRLTGPNADLTIGQNAGGTGNGTFIQQGGTIEVDGALVIGDGPNGFGQYTKSGGGLTVRGQMILGRNGGTGLFTQTGGDTVIDGQIVITESASGAGEYRITGGTLTADSLSVGENGGQGLLHIGPDATVSVTQSVVVGVNGRVTGTGTFDIGGATLTNHGLIEPGNSPGFIVAGAGFVQSSTGTLVVEIAGDGSPGLKFDQFVVDGDVTLGGTVVFDFTGGFAPTTGQAFDFIHILNGHSLLTDLPSVTVEVRGLELGWQYDLTHDGSTGLMALVSLSDATSAIPEPTALALLVVTVIGPWALQRGAR